MRGRLPAWGCTRTASNRAGLRSRIDVECRTMGAMPDLLSAPDYQLARFLLERGIAAIYLIAFAVAIQQFPALSGERGLEPAPRFLELVRFRQAPSIFHLRYSDR